jgi:hypothetical protein
MRSPKMTTAAVLAGAVALASAAYGIGTQSGDGTATARDGNGRADWERAPGPGPGLSLSFGFGDLADELGVDAQELRDALMDFGERQLDEHRDTFAAALAEALGKPVDEVRAALDEVGPGGDGRPGCAPHVSLRRLAAELDVTRAELREALREARAGERSAWEDRRDDLVAFLADRFGLSEDEVEQALPELPAPGRHGPPGPPPFGPGGPPE